MPGAHSNPRRSSPRPCVAVTRTARTSPVPYPEATPAGCEAGPTRLGFRAGRALPTQCRPARHRPRKAADDHRPPQRPRAPPDALLAGRWPCCRRRRARRLRSAAGARRRSTPRSSRRCTIPSSASGSAACRAPSRCTWAPRSPQGRPRAAVPSVLQPHRLGRVTSPSRTRIRTTPAGRSPTSAALESTILSAQGQALDLSEDNLVGRSGFFSSKYERYWSSAATTSWPSPTSPAGPGRSATPTTHTTRGPDGQRVRQARAGRRHDPRPFRRSRQRPHQATRHGQRRV